MRRDDCGGVAVTSDPKKSTYVLRVRTLWDPVWEDRFPGFIVSRDSAGNTVLTGAVEDQAALYGLISRARDLGLKLIAVEQVQDGGDPQGVGNP
jgi:hypothetical protein